MSSTYFDRIAARLHRAAPAALAATAILLSACGGGGGDEPAPAVSDTGAAAGEAATCALPEFRASLLASVNQVRATGADCGSEGFFEPAGPLAWNDLLAQAAQGHAQDMSDNNYFSHESLDGRTLSERVDATGYEWLMLGENIAAGQRTVAVVMQAWLDSPGHCANLMRPQFTEVGVACVPRARTSNRFATYWAMELGQPPR